jgi:hypothetical protein
MHAKPSTNLKRQNCLKEIEMISGVPEIIYGIIPANSRRKALLSREILQSNSPQGG